MTECVGTKSAYVLNNKAEFDKLPEITDLFKENSNYNIPDHEVMDLFLKVKNQEKFICCLCKNEAANVIFMDSCLETACRICLLEYLGISDYCPECDVSFSHYFTNVEISIAPPKEIDDWTSHLTKHRKSSSSDYSISDSEVYCFSHEQNVKHNILSTSTFNSHNHFQKEEKRKNDHYDNNSYINYDANDPNDSDIDINLEYLAFLNSTDKKRVRQTDENSPNNSNISWNNRSKEHIPNDYNTPPQDDSGNSSTSVSSSIYYDIPISEMHEKRSVGCSNNFQITNTYYESLNLSEEIFYDAIFSSNAKHQNKIEKDNDFIKKKLAEEENNDKENNLEEYFKKICEYDLKNNQENEKPDLFEKRDSPGNRVYTNKVKVSNPLNSRLEEMELREIFKSDINCPLYYNFNFNLKHMEKLFILSGNSRLLMKFDCVFSLKGNNYPPIYSI